MSGRYGRNRPDDRGGIRVLTVSADTAVCAWLRGVIGRAGDLSVVAEARTIGQTDRHIRVLRPDVALVAALGDGPKAVALVRSVIGREVPTLVMTSDRMRKRLPLWLYGTGLVDERATAGEIVAALRMVAAGYAVTSARMCRPVATPMPSSDSVRKLLTSREIEVLRLMAQGYSNARISAVLMLSENTVKSHVQRILTKLRLPNRLWAVILAYEIGLVSAGNGSVLLEALSDERAS